MPGWQIGYASACRAEKEDSISSPGFVSIRALLAGWLFIYVRIRDIGQEL